MMIEAEIYGMMFSAKIAMRWMPPPANILNMPRMPGLLVEDLVPGVGIDPRQRNVGAETIDQERAKGEPDALLQFFGFGERAKVEIGRQLFCCRNHPPLRAFTRRLGPVPDFDRTWAGHPTPSGTVRSRGCPAQGRPSGS